MVYLHTEDELRMATQPRKFLIVVVGTAALALTFTRCSESGGGSESVAETEQGHPFQVRYRLESMGEK